MQNLESVIRGKRNKKAGDIGESIVEIELHKMGFRLIEKVNTPWKVLWKNGRPIHAFPEKKVSGDFRALTPSGVSVLVEVKTCDGNLCYSAFEDHQLKSLNEHHESNGLTLVAYVKNMRVKFLEWPIIGFGPGKSVKFEKEPL